MIYTVTLNPAVDFILETSNFEAGTTNYYQNDYLLVGGKGINVGIILNNFHVPVVTTGFLGTKNKDFFLDQFQKSKLDHHFFLFEGKTRTNFKIKNLTQNQETELNGVGEKISLKLIEELLDYLHHSLKKNDIVVAGGSIASGIAENIYWQIGKIVEEKKAYFCLDTSKKQMKFGLKAQPFLIKPNLAEVGEILGQEINKKITFKEIKILIHKLQELGARNVLLSMGNKGSYFFGENGSLYQVGIAQGKLVNSVGAGDSMLAGFVYGFSQNFEIQKCLKYASAAGGATAFTQWLASKSEIEKHLNEIEVKKLEGEKWN